MSPSQWDIVRLGLTGNVQLFALDLMKAHPDVVYTAGLRMRADQARVMARNIAIAGIQWVEDTYRPSKAKQDILIWLREHPELKTADAIAIGLSALMDGLTNDELAGLSKHFAGLAVDIQPVHGNNGAMLKTTIKRLCKKYKLKFLEREGALERWHVQA